MLHTTLSGAVQERMQDRNEQDSMEQPGLRLVAKGERSDLRIKPKALQELASISARRCSAFFAEAAVLVLVFGILDFFMQHGHVDGGWVMGALMISLALLAASVGKEFCARPRLGAQPERG